MRRLAVICSFLLTGALAAPPGALARLPIIPGDARCAEGSPESAATQIFGGGTEVVARETVAGLEGARVLEPRIAPGTRARMLLVGKSWCEATSSFNLAWRSAGRTFGGTKLESAARAYVQLAAAPYFDGVTVRSIRPTAPGTFEIRTHAFTNGIDATWLVALDAQGVRLATWTATAFAQQPLEGQNEGLTALPGASETYTRTVRGLLDAERGLPTAKSARQAAAPSIAEYVSPDDFVIAVSAGDSRVAIDPGMDTGVRRADIVRENLRAIKENYEEFYSWGLRKGWGELEPVSGPDKGYVYINDALSMYCFACVFIADDFQIHMHSEVELILDRLGYRYPDGVKAYSNIIGHEMFHNFQNRYNKPGPLLRGQGRGVSTAYSEGTARAQEAMHGYSDVSFQEESLIYARDTNGCNGFQRPQFDMAMASGIFNKSYSACFFWLSWFAAEGKQGLKRLIANAYPEVSPEPDLYIEGVAALRLASRLSVPQQAARFAGAAITGRGYRLSGHNWAKMLDLWQPLELDRGDSASANLSPSGLFARRIDSAATVRLSQSSDATLFVITDTGGRTTTRVVSGHSVCVTPKRGQKVWVGAVRTKDGNGSAEMTASRPTCR